MPSPEQEKADRSGLPSDDPTLRMGFPAPAFGNAIGPYRLIQPIGQGGMGEVWLAEQREPVRRRVAVKLIKAGMDTREVVARFESERQALALMDHPAIAKVFDAGSTPDGRPYFAMEYVRGIPITAYCDKHKLTMRQRLELFVRVCEGVQHAHQKAVIHRDLKPSNILVSDVDRSPMPRIIDFGIAKATSLPLTAETMLTRLGAIVGTPGYMSPEQADSAGEDIDTRSDVYSLGVVLYQLLVGVPPLDFHKVPVDQIPRKLREEEAPRPSTKLRSLGDDSKITAENRHTDPPTLARQLRGDLDAIALKALEKDRSRRYGSPSDLAADIGRYLKNEPVLAVGPSAAYLARKFGRRYRGPLITACAFALVLIAAAGISIWQSVRATKQRDRADAEAAVAQAVDDFLQNDLLAQASSRAQSRPNSRPDPDLKVRTALDRAAERITGRFAKQPLVEASIRQTIGATYFDLGLYPDAQRQLERALGLRRGVLGEQHPDTLTSMSSLALLYAAQANYAQAGPLYTKTVEGRRRVLGEEHPNTLDSMKGLAQMYVAQANYARAEPLFTKVLEGQRRLLGEEHPDTLGTMNDLAGVYSAQGKFAQSEALLAQVVQAWRRVLGDEHPYTLAGMNNLAMVYFYQGKYSQAEPLYTKVLEVSRRVLGDEHPDTVKTMSGLATVYRRQGKYPEAEALHTKALGIERRALGEEHPTTLTIMSNLAQDYQDLGKYPQAEAFNIKVLEVRRRVLGEEHPSTLLSMHNLAMLYLSQRKYSQAEPLLTKTLEVRRRVLGEEHPDTLNTMNSLATLYGSQGKYVESEQLYNKLVEARRRALGPQHADTISALTYLGGVFLQQHKYAEAERVVREALANYENAMPDAWQRFNSQSMLGASLAGQQKYTEAEPLLLSGYEGLMQRVSTIPVTSRFNLENAGAWIVQLYQGWEKPGKAAEWAQKLQQTKLAASSK